MKKRIVFAITLIAAFLSPVTSAHALSCPTGSHAASSTTCIPDAATVNPLSVSSTVNCPPSYTFNSSTLLCESVSTEDVTITQTTPDCVLPGVASYQGTQLVCSYPLSTYQGTVTHNYSCPTGYIASADGTKCTTTTGAVNQAAAADTTYLCPNGGTLSGTICNVAPYTDPATIVPAASSSVEKCADGSSPVAHACPYTITSSYDAVQTPSYWYDCPSGYSLSADNTTCIYNLYWYVTVASTQHAGYTTLSCPYGGNLQLTKCETTTQGSFATYTETVYTCSSGDLVGTNCVISGASHPATTYNATPNTVYSCPNGGTLSSAPYYSCIGAGTTTTVNAYDTITSNCPIPGSYGSIPYGTCIQPSYMVNITSTNVYSCANSAGQNYIYANGVCTWSLTAQNLGYTYTGFCPVNYVLDTNTGICNAQQFAPNGVFSVHAIYTCTQNDSFGNVAQHFTSVTDRSNAYTTGIYVSCQLMTTPSLTIGDDYNTYICETLYSDGSVLDYGANADYSSSDPNNNSVTTCALGSRIITVTGTNPFLPTDVTDIYVPTPAEIACGNPSTFTEIISCLNS